MFNGNLRKKPMEHSWFHIVAIGWHTIQFIAMTIIYFNNERVRDFNKMLTTTYYIFNNSTGTLQQKSKDIGSVNIGFIALLFIFITIIAHMFYWHKTKKTRTFGVLSVGRWVEYSITSSLMLLCIMLLVGCSDICTLTIMTSNNFSMIMCGLAMEWVNTNNNNKRHQVTWFPFYIGCFVGIWPWFTIFMYMGIEENGSYIPWFVYVIVFGYIVFFNSFAVNMFMFFKYRRNVTEYNCNYIILSLTSKSFLAWFIFLGTSQPV